MDKLKVLIHSYNHEKSDFSKKLESIGTQYRVLSLIVNFGLVKIFSKINKDNIETWWEIYNSGLDVERDDFIHGKIEKNISSLEDNASILDIGAAWASPLKFTKTNQKYIGVDMDLGFLDGLKKYYPEKNFDIVAGSLPDSINVEGSFDLVICAMVFHWVDELEESIKTLSTKVKQGGKMLLVIYSDESQDIHQKNNFIFSTQIREKNYFQGKVIHSGSTKPLYMEIRYHKENYIESILKSMGINYIKTYSQENQFVSYECL